MLLLLPLMLSAQAWEPIHHGRHAHRILEVTGTTIAVAGVGLIIAAPIVVAADPECDMDACGLQMGLGLGLTGIVVTTVGMMTAGVASAFPCPAVNQEWALVATPRGVALTARF